MSLQDPRVRDRCVLIQFCRIIRPGPLATCMSRRQLMADTFISIPPAGGKETIASGIYQPVALAFDRAWQPLCRQPWQLRVYPGDYLRMPAIDHHQNRAEWEPKHFRYDSSRLQLLGVAFDGAGNLFVSTSAKIVKIARDGTQSTFASGLHGAWPLAFDSFGNLYAGSGSSIVKFAPDGSSDDICHVHRSWFFHYRAGFRGWRRSFCAQGVVDFEDCARQNSNNFRHKRQVFLSSRL